jgi:hypothetical protein
MMIGLELVSLYSFQCGNMGIWLMIAMLHSVANLATIINELGLFFTGLITKVYLSSSESCDQVFFPIFAPLIRSTSSNGSSAKDIFQYSSVLLGMERFALCKFQKTHLQGPCHFHWVHPDNCFAGLHHLQCMI